MLADRIRHLIRRNETKTTRLSTHIEFLDEVSMFIGNYGQDLLRIVEEHERRQSADKVLDPQS
jgi:hypothetical protein